jgi:signal transduction histidine kinase
VTRRDGFPFWAVTLGLGLTVAAVGGATAFEEHIARRIDTAAAVVSRDVAPAVSVLGEVRLLTTYQTERARAEVQGVPWAPAVAIRDSFELQRPPPASIEEAGVRLGALFEKGSALTPAGDDADLERALREHVRAFEDAIRRAREQARGGDREAASRTLREDVNAHAAGIHLAATALLEHKATAADESARHIEDSRGQLRSVQHLLVVLVALLAVAAAGVAFWTFRQVAQAHALSRKAFEDRAEELEAFAGRVAHDVLGPLTSVSTALFVAKKHDLPEPVRNATARAQASLRRVRQIVDGLLSFARAGARDPRAGRAQIGLVVAGLLEELAEDAREARAVLGTDGEVPECTVSCSEGVLLSLLGNLLRNALKYLGSSRTREVTLSVSCHRPGSVLFEVIDTGPGVPEEARGRIFDLYVRAAGTEGTPGIGLGLATVRKLAASHGGRAGYRPRSGGGSVFWFELPEARSVAHGSAELVQPESA